MVDLLHEAVWECGRTPPGEGTPTRWLPAAVPGTAAAALLAVGDWDGESPLELDGDDWWWRCHVSTGPGAWLLRADGLSVGGEVHLQGSVVLSTSGAFTWAETVLQELPAGRLEVLVRCAALGPRLAGRHPRPRWRVASLPAQALRAERAPLLGRLAGTAGTAPVVGPWRALRLVPLAELPLRSSRLRSRLDGDTGLIEVGVRPRAGARVGAAASVHAAGRRAALVQRGADLVATVRVPAAPRWWPHTHGPAPLVQVELDLDDGSGPRSVRRVGFRTLEADRSDGAFSLVVNGIDVFARGACWVPLDPVSLQSPPPAYRAALQQLTEAGLNMVRLTGDSVYETSTFHDLCDELGLLVWQDLMVNRVDLPDDPGFVQGFLLEVRQQLSVLQGRPSTSVVSGSEETEQQAALLGLAPAATRSALLTETVAQEVGGLLPGTPYVPSTPTGGAFAVRSEGVSHWFGVGGYLLPVAAARTAGVRFAAQCLAVSVPPEETTVTRAFGGPAPAGHAPRWKRAVPRDPGASWDFEDVRDHYVRDLFGVEPAVVRRSDPGRALDLARAAAAHLVESVLSTWRTPGSQCAGALLMATRDLVRGAGWGLVDADGMAKATWWAARRVCRPLVLLAQDRGLDGLLLHAVNDAATPVRARLRVRAWADGEVAVADADAPVEVPARGSVSVDAEEVLGGLRDLTWSWRFGLAAADVVAATLEGADGVELARSVFLPLGLARTPEPDLGLAATAAPNEGAGDGWEVRVATRRFAQSVVVEAPGCSATSSWESLLPGESRRVRLLPQPTSPGEVNARQVATVRALNGRHSLSVPLSLPLTPGGRERR